MNVRGPQKLQGLTSTVDQLERQLAELRESNASQEKANQEFTAEVDAQKAQVRKLNQNQLGIRHIDSIAIIQTHNHHRFSSRASRLD